MASNNDYSLVTTTVYEFSPDDTEAEVTFTVLDDDIVERVEGLVLSVTGAEGSPNVLPGTNPTTNVFITDTDGKLPSIVLYNIICANLFLYYYSYLASYI